ncbi:MAG: type II toxin-antitoxin system RelE/ParE family toxin [Alphaproteobacteria bacterium]|nr:type II toxin-antitoxin system RelE/ParE family toxin [Alphaproteobacteria bacterium]
MRIEWLPKAKANLDSQLDYIAETNPWAAIELGDAIEAAVSRLADFPESARPGRVRGTRELVISKTPFIAVYRIEKSALLILRLLHGAQIWPPRP